MTVKEKFRKMHPSMSDEEYEKYLLTCCPTDTLPYPEYCTGGRNYEDCAKCWDRQVSEELTTDKVEPEKTEPTIKDSGDRTQFESGAVRDMREGKGRCDLMPLEVVGYIFSHEPGISKIFDNIAMFKKEGDTAYLTMVICDFAKDAYPNRLHPEVHMLLEVAKHFEEGAKKYGENNWQKGIPVHCYIDSAVRHYLKWLRGDKDEPHDRAFVWNLICCIWEVDYGEEWRASKKED